MESEKIDVEKALEEVACINCGEKLPEVLPDINHRKYPIGVIWFDEGHPGNRHEPPEPATIYTECWKCYVKNKKDKIRIVWDLPPDSKTFREIGKVIFFLTRHVRQMELLYADAEGMIFAVEFIYSTFRDFEKLLKDMELERVTVSFEEVEE
ncbi:MAG: hypothetical protein ACXQS2_05590 [Methermicoccaceae archaeon]